MEKRRKKKKKWEWISLRRRRLRNMKVWRTDRDAIIPLLSWLNDHLICWFSKNFVHNIVWKTQKVIWQNFKTLFWLFFLSSESSNTHLTIWLNKYSVWGTRTLTFFPPNVKIVADMTSPTFLLNLFSQQSVLLASICYPKSCPLCALQGT